MLITVLARCARRIFYWDVPPKGASFANIHYLRVTCYFFFCNELLIHSSIGLRLDPNHAHPYLVLMRRQGLHDDSS